MNILADLLEGPYCRHQFFREVARMRGDEAYALDPGDRVDHFQQVRQILPFRRTLAIGIDILTEERHLLITLLGEALYLAVDGRCRTALLAPSGIGHNTEGAKLIAPLHHGYPGLEGALATNRKALFIPQRVISEIAELLTTGLDLLEEGG